MTEQNEPNDGPIYNIGVVARVTGVHIPTLRAWERRYGFPRASRTSGGHRLYSERDVARLRWVKAQLDQGLSTRQAIIAVQKNDADKQLLLEARSELFQPPLPTPSLDIPGRGTLMTALLQHDLNAADRLIGEMLAIYSPEELTLQVIGPTLYDIGEAWERGQINVATEHLASNYLRHRLLMWMVTGPRTQAPNPVVLACAPGEWHEGSILMLGVFLRRRGYPISYLGQNVPFADLAKFILRASPPIVVLVAMREETARNLADWTNWIKQIGGKPVVAFGGRAFIVQPDLAAETPGVYLGDSILEGLDRIVSFLQKSS